jgi:hypothetical protein
VEKGAQVNVSGRRVEIKPDGRFAARASLWQKRDTVEIIVEHNGHKKTLQRHFRVKPL